MMKKKNLYFFIGMLFFGAVFIVAYLALFGNLDQIYHDIVSDYMSAHGCNKTMERVLVYLLSVVGILAYGSFYFANLKKPVDNIENSGHRVEAYLYPIVGLFVAIIVRATLYGSFDWILVGGFIIALLLCVFDRNSVIPGLSFFFILIYSMCGLYRVYVLFFGGESGKSISLSLITVFSSLITSSFLCFRKNAIKEYIRASMIAQLFVPFTMLVLLFSNYKFGDGFLKIRIPLRISFAVWVFVIIFVMEAAWSLSKNWGNAENIGKTITYGLCISIMAFNRFGGSGSVITTDLHHTFENIIGYSQIFELKRIPFKEYIPVSGMYSLLHGFFLDLFGHGQMAFYNASSNLFYLLFTVLVVLFVKKQVKGEWALLASLIFTITDKELFDFDYDRIVMIAPTMVLLAYPKLIKNKNLWLKVWILTSLVGGLYYPVYGAATCLGYLPLGIWQIYTFIRSEEFKNSYRQPLFWLWWLTSLIPVVLSFRLLLETAKHTLAMSKQSLYADGFSRFGQVIPDSFLAYIDNLSTRLIVYYIFSFLIIISVVWLSFALVFDISEISFDGKRIHINKPDRAAVAVSFGIALLVAFSFTTMRMEIHCIYSRSSSIILMSFLMIVLILTGISENRNSIWIFAFAVFIIAVNNGEGLLNLNLNNKLDAYYTVPDGYIHVENDKVEKLGECFAESGEYENIENTYDFARSLDQERSYFGIFNNFGMYYLCGIKGDSLLEIGSIKGYEAAKESINLIRNNGSIVGSNLNSVSNYYLYNYLVNSGEYIWSPETSTFIPNDGSISKDRVFDINKDNTVSLDEADLGKTPGSWGRSIDSLYEILGDKEIEYGFSSNDKSIDIEFNKTISGSDADFVYIEFENTENECVGTLFDRTSSYVQDNHGSMLLMRLLKSEYNPGVDVLCSWTDDRGKTHSAMCEMDNGKLLIPLGGLRGWLLNEHAELDIAVKKGDEYIEVPNISSLKLLKLRETR